MTDSTNPPPSPLLLALKNGYQFISGAEKILDYQRGEGYAEENPEIVAALAVAAALDYHARTPRDGA